MTEYLIDYIKNLNEFWIYLFLIFSTYTENVFPPWPGDTFIVFAGFLIYHDVLKPLETYLVTTIGNLLGAYTMYFLGEFILKLAHSVHKKLKIGWLSKILESMISDEQMKKAKYWFDKWGFLFVVLSRFSAGIRYFVSIIAGLTKMNFFIFSLAFFIGILIWNTLLFAGGYLLGENWSKILEWLKMYNIVIGVIILLIIIFVIYNKFISSKK